MQDITNETYSITGYHGTVLDCCDSICSGGFDLARSERNDHWLGNGIYFYDNEFLALEWSRTFVEFKHKQGEDHKEAVIRALLQALRSEVIDFNYPPSLEAFNQFCREYEGQIIRGYRIRRKEGETTEKFNKRLKCLFLDVYKRQNKCAIIIYTFHKYSPRYARVTSTMSFEYNELQICVTDNRFIKNREICYPIAGGI